MWYLNQFNNKRELFGKWCETPPQTHTLIVKLKAGKGRTKRKTIIR